MALPERRVPLLARDAACPLVAREHNEHNVDSASPVPEHFSNEPFFDSRDEATAEPSTSSTIVQLHGVLPAGIQVTKGVQESNRADVGALILAAMASKKLCWTTLITQNASKTRKSDHHGKLSDDRTLA